MRSVMQFVDKISQFQVGTYIVQWDEAIFWPHLLHSFFQPFERQSLWSSWFSHSASSKPAIQKLFNCSFFHFYIFPFKNRKMYKWYLYKCLSPIWLTIKWKASKDVSFTNLSNSTLQIDMKLYGEFKPHLMAVNSRQYSQQLVKH